MDPAHALLSNQKGFEQDLEQMINDILSGSSASASTSTPGSTEVSPTFATSQQDPRNAQHKRLLSSHTDTTDDSPEPSSPKRLKLDQSDLLSQSRDAHMHPARRAMLDEHAPHAPVTDDNLPEPLASGANAGHRRSVTAANSIPLGDPRAKTNDGAATWSTLQNTVQRQWDSRKDDLEYGELLKHRRKERVDRVDRYVPAWTPPKPEKPKNQAFPFEKFPEQVRDKVISLLVVSREPIDIDFTWLRPFVKGHARVPVVTQKLRGEDGASYMAPVTWTKLLEDVKSMQSDMIKFKGALESRGVKTKGRRSPARYLTTSLLRVSRSLHKSAARAFYGENTFLFSYAPGAWMQLESFMETIGLRNVTEIKHIRIAAPMFPRGMQEDYVEGAILDLMSPATRMATVKPPARDRLLSAIQHSVDKLKAANRLETLTLDLEHPMASDLWSGRYVNDKRMISVAEAEKHAKRKTIAITLLNEASEMLTAKGNKPTLMLHHFSKASKRDVNQFRNSFAGVVTEAEKYGWRVHPRLEDGK